MMDLQQALKWADNNTSDEAVNRLRSRQVAKILATTVRNYATLLQEHNILDLPDSVRFTSNNPD